MTLALKLFMNTSDVEEIVQKFCYPGHSEIQEVDNVHSGIENVLKVCEVYIPVPLIRAMKSVRSKADFNIIQITKKHYNDYLKATQSLKFSNIPFTKVKCLRYEKHRPMDVDLKLSFSDVSYRTVTLYGRPPTRNSVPTAVLPLAPLLRNQPVVSLEKNTRSYPYV
ncbi:hypothetical protein DPMN_064827 [Dreissena polymorpha]|uniref:Uncharacterized protein n=1 Tax=Dreissena polymorpha TaxID=45954 RepID=A0A9D4HLG9_DREPO|nr:hypothetical protein DPMN_064824 [Dreissena polymorpha]KAH3721878.1 hypothetical protein DPMN_064827 [Dreissena polymorpha]